jgi:GT2 family glycosyltransferase
VCIVTYRAREVLSECLNSLYQNTVDLALEVIVVDNGSRDGIGEMLHRDYSSVRLLENESNLGYTRPMNQALMTGRGTYLLQLNPDTLILPNAIQYLISFMEEHPEAGICGPKVLNRDRTFQKQCRRGEPRPLAVISYFLGLNQLFPKSRFLGGYLLNYLDENEITPVGGVSGSCMLMRREMLEQIGYLDERFFAYQEDADICYRARQAGWDVYYVPTAQIIHYGGQGGTRVEPYRSILEWHRSYWLYYQKNLAKDYIFLFNWFFYSLMLGKLGLALAVNFFRKEKYAGPKR